MSLSGNRIDMFQQNKEFDYLCVTDSLPGITGNYRSVYFALVSINNSKFWAPIFDVDFDYVLALSKVDKDTYRRAMDFLNNAGLFDFYEKGVNKYVRARVSLKVLAGEKPTGNTTGNPVGNAVRMAVVNAASDAHFNKTVTKTSKQEINNNQLDFIEPEFEETFNTWLNYKKGRRESYKTTESTQVAYNKLKKDSVGDPAAAAQIIESAIGNNYAGFFPLRNNTAPVSGHAAARSQSKAADIINQNNILRR